MRTSQTAQGDGETVRTAFSFFMNSVTTRRMREQSYAVKNQRRRSSHRLTVSLRRSQGSQSFSLPQAIRSSRDRAVSVINTTRAMNNTLYDAAVPNASA